VSHARIQGGVVASMNGNNNHEAVLEKRRAAAPVAAAAAAAPAAGAGAAAEPPAAAAAALEAAPVEPLNARYDVFTHASLHMAMTWRSSDSSRAGGNLNCLPPRRQALHFGQVQQLGLRPRGVGDDRLHPPARR
jgi:hypothetical protein